MFFGSIVDREIVKANSKLNKIKILRRGKVLSLRGILPPKPGDGNKPKRYTISTGLPANKQGLTLAVAKAQQIEIDLLYERFTWGNNKQLTVEKAIAQFEENFWQKKKKTISRADNYKEDYLKPFLYLPQDEVLTGDLLKRALLTTEADSRKRLRFAVAYNALAKFAEIEVNLSELKGSYKPQVIRQIPTEEEIERYWQSISNPGWRWVFGIIATFGIRPHEIFHLDISRLWEYPPILQVGEKTKTNYRLVYPIPNERWVTNWNLGECLMPNIAVEGKSNRQLGTKIGQGFHERKIPSPYHFRDAYAIRGVIYNFNPANVAKWMGHSLNVHEQKYLRHMQEKHFSDAWEKNQF